MTAEALALVTAPRSLECRYSGPIGHRCPYLDERDHGVVEISWTTNGRTIEVHSLVEYLAAFTEKRISHEELVATIRGDLTECQDIANIDVECSFSMAGGVEYAVAS